MVCVMSVRAFPTTQNRDLQLDQNSSSREPTVVAVATTTAIHQVETPNERLPPLHSHPASWRPVWCCLQSASSAKKDGSFRSSAEHVSDSQDFPAHTGTLEFQLYPTTRSGVDRPSVSAQIEPHEKAASSTAVVVLLSLSVVSAASPATTKAANQNSKIFPMWIIALIFPLGFIICSGIAQRINFPMSGTSNFGSLWSFWYIIVKRHEVLV